MTNEAKRSEDSDKDLSVTMSDPPLTRAYASHEPTWQRFIIKNDRPKTAGSTQKVTTHPYNRQYSHMCTRRLMELRPRCLATVQADWDAQQQKIKDNDGGRERSGSTFSTQKPDVVGRIIDLKENTFSTIVGTFLKEMPSRPMFVDSTAALLDEDDDALNKIFPPVGTSSTYSSPNHDTLILEDESGRVELSFDENTRVLNPPKSQNEHSTTSKQSDNTITIGEVCSGGVAAITGVMKSNSGGVMTVHSVAFPLLAPNKTESSNDVSTEGGDGRIANKTIIASPESRTLRPALNSNGSVIESLQMMASSPCVLLVSGLQTTMVSQTESSNQNDTSHALRLDILVDFISGNLPGTEYHAANIARVIVAGNSTGPYPCTERLLRANRKLYSGVMGGDGTSLNGNKNGSNKKARTTNGENNNSGSGGSGSVIGRLVKPIEELDRLLGTLVKATVPVDILPGREDPTNTNWPQQPLHRCLLPFTLNSSGFGDGVESESLVKRAPNPYEATIASRVILGTDGLNIRDLSQFLSKPLRETDKNGTQHGSSGGSNDDEEEKKEDSLTEDGAESKNVPLTEIELLRQTLLFGHLAPSAPDSLPSYPFLTEDPFIIQDVPHVYFAGNCKAYDSKLVSVQTACDATDEHGVGNSKCRLICIPNFAITQQIVLLNLETLETQCISIKDSVDDLSP